MSRKRISAEEANELFDEILEEDGNKDDDGSDNCSAECAEEDPADQKKLCDCIRMAEHSSRFSLRVMEAMRSLQNDDYDFLPTSSVEDIVDYIRENYRDDGDLYAQVRTALKQVCSQGFVMELLENEYHWIGPYAAAMNKITCSKGRKDCLLSSPAKTPKRRKQNNSEDTCLCITPSNKKGAKQLERTRYSKLEAVRGNREEDKLTESCTCTLTDEDVDTGVYEKGTPKRVQHALKNRGRRAMETGDARKDVVTDILEEIDDNDRIRSAKDQQRQRELERWIERCRKECERQKNR